MLMRDCLITDILYTHYDPDTGEQVDYNVSAIERDKRFAKAEIVSMPIDRQHAELTLQQRGIERHRLNRVVALIKEKLWDLPPVMLYQMLDGTHLLMDGNHRYVGAFVLGLTEYPARLVKHNLVKDYVVEGVPKIPKNDMLKSFSGIA